jgi:putative FmdB family regulatory protein
MPTYEYVCPSCDHEFEAFQSMKDDPLKTCPACRRRSIKRKVGSGAGLIFKGSGFYITDYKNKQPAKSESGNGSTGGEGGGSTKPAETKAAESKVQPASKPAAPAKT